MSEGLSRRRLFGLGAAGVAAVGAGALATRSLAEQPVALASATSDAVPFYGAHQAGITTPAQDRLHFVAFDVITKDRGSWWSCSRSGRRPRPG